MFLKTTWVSEALARRFVEIRFDVLPGDAMRQASRKSRRGTQECVRHVAAFGIMLFGSHAVAQQYAISTYAGGGTTPVAGN